MSSLCRLRSWKLRCLDGDPNIRGGDSAKKITKGSCPSWSAGAFEPSPSDSELDDPIKPRVGPGAATTGWARGTTCRRGPSVPRPVPAVPPRSVMFGWPEGFRILRRNRAPQGTPPPPRANRARTVRHAGRPPPERVPFVPSFAPFGPSQTRETRARRMKRSGPIRRPGPLISRIPRLASSARIEPGTAEPADRAPRSGIPFEVTHTGSMLGNPAGGFGGFACATTRRRRDSRSAEGSTRAATATPRRDPPR